MSELPDEDVALLRLLPQTFFYVPVDSRRADAETLRQLAAVHRLKRDGYLTAQVEPRSPGFYDLTCLLTMKGAWAARRAP